MNNPAEKQDNIYNKSSFNDDTIPENDSVDLSKIEDLSSRLDKFAKDSFIGTGRKTDSNRQIRTFELRCLAREITRRKLIKKKNELIKERNSLIQKKYDSDLTGSEKNRLEFIRWQLDRIDDAEIGDQLDSYEKMAEEYKKFSYDLEKLIKTVSRGPK